MNGNSLFCKANMNIAVIFAGGAGTRMNSRGKPKQFLEVNGKPIIIHTLEIFEENTNIDAIVIACIENAIEHMQQLAMKHNLKKIKKIVPGGDTGQMSIYHGLCAAQEVAGKYADSAIVLIHDGVRPMIDGQVIDDNIESVRQFGSAVTAAASKETVVLVDEKGFIEDATNRAVTRIAKAPQSFYLKEVLEVERLAIKEGKKNVIDTCTLMHMYGKPIHVIEGSSENIKVTTPDDFYTLRALLQARENSQIYGL